jgi:hypothetical protein
MTDHVGADRYRRLFERLGEARAREIIDKLQVVALTNLDALHEVEAFLDRGVGANAPDGPAKDGGSGHGPDDAEG